MYTHSRVNLHTLEHDLLLNEVRFLLEEVVGVEQWLDIRHMRSDAVGKPFDVEFSSLQMDDQAAKDEVIPDSIFKHTREGSELGFSLELELSLKRSNRYSKLVEQYFEQRSISTVFFIVRNEIIRNAIIRGGRRCNLERFPKLAICTIEELFERGANASMQVSETSFKPLHALIDCKGARPEVVPPGVQPQDTEELSP